MFAKIKKKLEFDRVALAFFGLALMTFLNNIGDGGTPFAAALYFCILVCGGGVLSSSGLYLLSFALTLEACLGVAVLAQSVVLCVIYGTFLKKHKHGLTSLVFLPASLIPYVLIGGEAEYLSRLTDTVLITSLSAAFYPFVKGFSVKGFRRPSGVEIASFAALYVCAWVGGIKYLGFDLYKAVAIVGLAAVSILLGGKESCFVAIIVAVPAVLNQRVVELFAPFLLFGVVSFLFASSPRPVYASMLVAAELASAYLFGWYGEYGWVSLLYPCVAVLVVVPLPSSLVSRWSRMLALSSSRPLSRLEINRARNVVSGRLYEISATFNQMGELFNALAEHENPFAYEDAIIEEISVICDGCAFKGKCRVSGFPERDELVRLIAIAKGKGRLTAVDFPKRFTDKCGQTGKILFAVNKYVSMYAAEIERKKASAEVKELIGLQASGVALAVKGVALRCGKQLAFCRDKESKLSSFLLKKGVNLQEAMIFGEGDGIEIHMITAEGVDADRLIACVNECFKAKFCIAERYSLEGRKEFFMLERACKTDCVFGVATVAKEGESECGDTHTLIKLGRNKFMLALSDGMGSGEDANAVSGVSLSLIECLFRSGISSEVALNTVNRLISYSKEDNFSALDLGVICLDGMSCDFIKLGAPYGFIVSASSVKVIEGSSLPMGILGEIRPAVCSEPISEGDVILFLSDGVTDAFGSATDLADFLSAVAISNPQRLADKILDEAVSLYGNEAKDDMTVVACKIYGV